MEIGTKLIAINNQCLKGKDYAPELKIGKEYKLKAVILDRDGHPHFDVGLKSNLNYITSFETGEQLKDGNKIHWCHPSRFELA